MIKFVHIKEKILEIYIQVKKFNFSCFLFNSTHYVGIFYRTIIAVCEIIDPFISRESMISCKISRSALKNN